jgi:lipoate-protein ligase A
MACGGVGREQEWNEARLATPVLEPAWRLWAYREPAVVLGCSQRALLAAARGTGAVEVLVRSSGGGAVLTGPWMLGLSMALPTAHSLVASSPVASYRWLGELLAATLRRAGIAAQAVPPDSPGLRRDAELSWACFGALSAWEVAVRDRKIAGLAQTRRRHGVLLVGGLLLGAPDWPLLCATLGRPADQAQRLARGAASCLEEGGKPDEMSRLVESLEQGLSRAAARVRTVP